MDILADILLEAFLWTLLGGGVLAMLVGCWLLVAPLSFARFSRVLNRWLSTRRAAQWLETPRPIERFFYRRHRVFGLLLVAGAAFALYYLLFSYETVEMLAAFVLPWAGPEGDVIAATVTGFLLFGNAMILLIGGIVLVRPSLLKGVEATSNRWVSTGNALEALDRRSDLPDQAVVRAPRLAGLALALAGLYTTLQLGLFLA